MMHSFDYESKCHEFFIHLTGVVSSLPDYFYKTIDFSLDGLKCIYLEARLIGQVINFVDERDNMNT